MEDEAFPPSESEEDKVMDEDALTSSSGKLFFSCSGCLSLHTVCFLCLSVCCLSVYISVCVCPIKLSLSLSLLCVVHCPRTSLPFPVHSVSSHVM